MKNVIAELDRIAKYVEDLEENWSIHIAYRIDRVSQHLEDTHTGKIDNKISKSVLAHYKEDMEFLTQKESKLTKLIKDEKSRSANTVYKKIKDHFGKLDKKESMRFIKNVLKNID